LFARSSESPSTGTSPKVVDTDVRLRHAVRKLTPEMLVSTSIRIGIRPIIVMW